jgi:hypothetical protein
VNELFEYGIHNEHSDIRAHVGVVARMVFVFKKQAGIDAMQEAEERCASQPGVNGIPTGLGKIVPIGSIAGLRLIKLTHWPIWEKFSNIMTTTEKGKLAVWIVIETLKRGYFPLWIDATETDDKNIQILGTDIIIDLKKRVQVKCDWRAGPRHIDGCSGNVFLQTYECNPLRRW